MATWELDAPILLVCALVVGGVFVLLGFRLKRGGHRLYHRYIGAVKELVKIRKLLFMRGIVGFIAMSETVEVHDRLLADFDFSGDEPSTEELDRLGLELERRATGLREKILSLAKDAQGIDEPLTMLRDTRDSKIVVGYGFISLGFLIALGAITITFLVGSLSASATFPFYLFIGSSALTGAWIGSRFISSLRKERDLEGAIGEWEMKYELGSKDAEDVVLYLLDQSKAFKGLGNMISYRSPNMSVVIEVCNRISDICAALGKYFDSKHQE